MIYWAIVLIVITISPSNTRNGPSICPIATEIASPTPPGTFCIWGNKFIPSRCNLIASLEFPALFLAHEHTHFGEILLESSSFF